MGYKRFQTESKIREIFDAARKATKNFTVIDDDVISKYPKTLLIIRLSAGIPQKKFSKMLGINRSTLVHLELGISKTMRVETAKRISDKLREIVQKTEITMESTLTNYKDLWFMAEHGQTVENLRNYGRSAFKTRKPNSEEKEVSGILDKLGITYKREGELKFFEVPFFFDFILPNPKSPRFIIECKKISSKKNRNFRVTVYKTAYEIGYKFRLLKERHPEVKTIFLMWAEEKRIPERVSKILNNEVDYFFHNPTSHDIVNIIQKISHPRLG